MLKLLADWKAPAGYERSLNKWHWFCKMVVADSTARTQIKDEPLCQSLGYWNVCSPGVFVLLLHSDCKRTNCFSTLFWFQRNLTEDGERDLRDLSADKLITINNMCCYCLDIILQLSKSTKPFTGLIPLELQIKNKSNIAGVTIHGFHSGMTKIIYFQLTSY